MIDLDLDGDLRHHLVVKIDPHRMLSQRFDATGEITALAGSPFVGPGGRTGGTHFTADGSRMFIRTYNAATLGVYDLAADGTPTAVAGSPFTMSDLGAGDACMRVS